MIFPTQSQRYFHVKRQEGAGASALFLLGSLVSHGLVFGIAASVSSGVRHEEPKSHALVEFELTQQPPTPVRAPEQATPAPEVPRPKTKRAIRKKVEPQLDASKVTAKAPTVLTKQTQVAEPSEHSLPSVDDASAQESETSETDVIDAGAAEQVVDATQPAGLGDGHASELDPRVLIRAWMKKVQRSVQMRAVRDYPRAAQRMRLQGNVFVAMDVDANGNVTRVRTSRPSGHDVLDRAAEQAVVTIGQLPAPPSEFLRLGRPLTIPIAYRIR